MMILLSFLVSIAYAAEPLHWSYLTGVSDKHEFYQNHQVITAPQNAWQSLFALKYLGKDLNEMKDCVYYRVPGDASGILKIKSISSLQSCDQYLLEKGDIEVPEIKSLEFNLTDKSVEIDFSKADFSVVKWEGEFTSSREKTEGTHKSSAETRASKLIFLSDKTLGTSPTKKGSERVSSLCHEINDDCQEVSPSTCSLCPNGWHEVPNGCESGPKYCGMRECGKKNGPACRRGMKWQRKEIDPDCRADQSFAYCEKGLKVTCEGQLAICR